LQKCTFTETRLKTLFQPQRRREKLHRFNRTVAWPWPDPDGQTMADLDGTWWAKVDLTDPEGDQQTLWTLTDHDMILTWPWQTPTWPLHDVDKTLTDPELTNDEIDEKERRQRQGNDDNNITDLKRQLVVTTLIVV